MHVRHFPRPRSSHDSRAQTTTALTAPDLRSRDDLGSFAVQVRRALQLGATRLEVDESACAAWSAGQLLVLEHLRRLAARCGARWTVVGLTAPAAPAPAPLPEGAGALWSR